jgi:hypothetical protein
MTGMMDNPEFLRSMSDMMSRPEVIDQVGLPGFRGTAADCRSLPPILNWLPWALRLGV